MVRIAALMLSCSAITGPLLATTSLSCGDHHLQMTNEEITFLGNPEEGAQIGDRRILNWRVHAAGGPEIGRFHVVTTVLSGDESGHVITATGSADFVNGEVHATIVATLPDASDENQSSGAPVEWAITGGTGTFTNAEGTLLTGPPPHDSASLADWVFELRMRCDP